MAAFSDLETFWRDARYGARVPRKNPGYAAVGEFLDVSRANLK
jgi:hypothetical protein